MEYIGLTILFVSALFTGLVAALKNRNGTYWFVLGFIFPILAPIVLLLFKETIKIDDSQPTPETHVKCPECKELVLKEAIKCKHCGCKLLPQI